MNEKDFEADTNARVQYRTAMLMREQLAKEKREKRKKVNMNHKTAVIKVKIKCRTNSHT